MSVLIEALCEAEELLAFHEGSAKPESEGEEPTVRVNGDDLARVLSKLRDARAEITRLLKQGQVPT